MPISSPPSSNVLFEMLTGEVVLYTVPLCAIPSPPSETIVAPNIAEL